MNICSNLDDYLDECLSENERALFQNHLLSCDSCRRESSIAESLDEQISRSWNSVSAPAAVTTFVHSTLDSSKTLVAQNSNVRKKIAIVLAVAASITVITSISIWTFLHSPANTSIATSQDKHDSQVDNNSGEFDSSSEFDIPAGTENHPTTLDSPVVLVSTGGKQDAVLIQEQQTSPNFTIVNAYRTISFDSNSNSGLEDHQR